MAWWGLADLRTQTFTAVDIAQMRAACGCDDATEEDRIAIGFALAKAFDDTGDYPASMSALEHANAIARERQVWNAQSFSSQVAAVSAAFVPGVATRGTPGHEVTFIVGLPRSGSTLVEQILASHSSVQGANTHENTRAAWKVQIDVFRPDQNS